MGKSSKDKRDAYYRLAKEDAYRARSAYKLLQLDATYHLLPSTPSPVLDLCAAPGSWSQVLSRTLPAGSKILAIDLQPMTPIPSVTTLQADITHPSTLPLITAFFSGSPVPLVICDGAPDVTGLHDLDEYVQSSLLLAALNLAVCVLAPGGTFVAKIFRGRDSDVLFAQLRCLFRRVTCAKPVSSRASSIEAFVVCEGYAPPDGFAPSLDRPLTAGWRPEREGEEAVREIVRFVAAGDLGEPDADANERGRGGEGSLDPVQAPTAPPYRRALEVRREKGGRRLCGEIGTGCETRYSG